MARDRRCPVGLAVSRAAQLAQEAAEDLARRSGGSCEIHNLIIDWSLLPLTECAIARALRNPAVWPGRGDLLNELAQVERDTFAARHTRGLDPYDLLTRAHQRSRDRGSATIMESDLAAALVEAGANDLRELRVRPDDFLKEIRGSEAPDREAPRASRTIFVAYPWQVYESREEYKATLTCLEGELSVRFLFAESRLTERHILDKIEGMISEAAFGIYDLTGWNGERRDGIRFGSRDGQACIHLVQPCNRRLRGCSSRHPRVRPR